MKLVALCGAAGAGKDTVADMLPARKLAFADTLYREVAEAFGVSVDDLQDRRFKESEQAQYRLENSNDGYFTAFCSKNAWPFAYLTRPRSPRQILQWWGDYRRAQDPDYFVEATRSAVQGMPGSFVITDVRFPNEAAMVRQLGGQIWQIKRPGYEAGGTGHASDTAGDEFGPDVILLNQGGLNELRAAALGEWNK